MYVLQYKVKYETVLRKQVDVYKYVLDVFD